MPEKNGQNGNGLQNNSKKTLNHSERMAKFRAKKAKNKQTFRVPNSGKFEHLRKELASFKKTHDAYIKYQNHKMAEEMAQQNNEPKTEPEIKNENDLVLEEPQKPADEVAKENDAEPMNFEDIEVEDSELDDPALDDELEKLEQKIKKEEELKAMGIDPESVEEPDEPEFAQEVRELMQKTDEKLEGAAFDEAFQSLSNEVEGEKIDSDDPEIDDPDVNEDVNRLEQEIKKEESKPTEQTATIADEPKPVEDPTKEELEEAKNQIAQTLKNINRRRQQRANAPVVNENGGNVDASKQADQTNKPIKLQMMRKLKNAIKDKPQKFKLSFAAPKKEKIAEASEFAENELREAKNAIIQKLKMANLRRQQNAQPQEKQTEELQAHTEPVSEEDTLITTKEKETQKMAEEEIKIKAEGEEVKAEENKIELADGENITPAEFISIYNQADRSVGNPQVTEYVKWQMREILAGSGADNTKIDETVDKLFNTCLFDRDDGIAAYYNHIKADMSASGKSRSSSSIMEMMIRGAGNNIRLALNGSFSNSAEQMIVHQKLLNLLLITYSPMAFSKGIDEKYLNNYFLDDSKNLESYYRTYINKNASDADVEDFAKSVSEIRVKEEEANRLKTEEEQQKAQPQQQPEELQEEIEPFEPIMEEQIENKETAELLFDEITEIKEESQNEPTLADDFEIARNNSNESEVIKIVEDLPENIIFENTVEKQINPESPKLDTHAFFKQIENNVLNPQKENNVVVETKPKDEPKPVYSVPPIPGMRSKAKQENINVAPALSKEEREAKELADAKVMLEHLRNNRTGTTEERADRARMINYYQGIVDKHKSMDELLKDSLELAEKARHENQERERRIKELKELENADKNDIIEDKENEPLEIGNEGEAPDTLRIDDFYNKLQMRMTDPDVTSQVRAELIDIVKEAGITDQERAFDIVDASYFEIKDTINSLYDSTVVTETKMSTDAPLFFYNAFISLKNTDLSTKDRIITAQKFADVMIRNYSPVAFAEKELDYFADNYTLNNRELLGGQLYNLGYNNLEVDKLINEISGVPENEQIEQDNAPNKNAEPQPLHIPNFKQWLNEQISNVNVHQQVRAELTDIIKSAGVTDQELLSQLVEFSHGILPKTIPSSPLLDGENPDMPDIASQFFAESYTAIGWAELNPKDRVITAQKIADLMLKHYSPVAFKELQLEQYANNYMVNNRELLGLHLDVKGFDKDKIEPLMDEVQAALAIAPEKEQPAVKPELTQEEKNRRLFGVDVDQYMRDKNAANPEPNQEPNPQQKPPVAEPPMQNPAPNQDLDMVDGAKLHNNLNLFTGMDVVNNRVNANIHNILKAAGVDEKNADAIGFAEIIADAYTQEKVPRADIPMRDITKHVFMSTYDALTKKGLTPNNKVETVQKITDELLKNYSPLVYTVEKLRKYGQNYVINDKNLLRECLTTLNVPENEIKAATQEAVKPNPEQKNNGVANKNGQQVRDNNPKQEPNPINSEARVAVFIDKLKAYNSMYKLNIDANEFAASVTEAWTLMKSGDDQKKTDGQKIMNNLFKDTLKQAFKVEKDQAYDEYRLPEYVDIIKSSNELLRSSMFAFTDLYHDKNSASLFEPTAFGGMTAKEMAKLTSGKSQWSMDQKSDEAWEIQSKEAKSLADKWLKEDKPYEKMIKEMNTLAENGKSLGRRDILLKLTAAEWMLENNEKMMIEDPDDPLNPMPNWGNRYWKAIVSAREALGVSKHTSMRDIIQADYAKSSKAVRSLHYNERQITDHIMDSKELSKIDSMDKQKEQFATQSARVELTDPQAEKQINEIVMTTDRMRLYIKTEDERLKIKNDPKSNNFITDKNLGKQKSDPTAQN